MLISEDLLYYSACVTDVSSDHTSRSRSTNEHGKVFFCVVFLAEK